MTVCDDIRTGIKILAVAGATAMINTLNNASGKELSWGFDPVNNNYVTMTPTGKTIHNTAMPVDIAAAWKAIIEAGIPYMDYTEGDIPGLQGENYDPAENICQNFAIKTVRTLNNMGIPAYAVAIVAINDKNERVRHEIVAIPSTTDSMLYTLDPLKGMFVRGAKTTLVAGETKLPVTTNITTLLNDPLSWIPTAKIKMETTKEVPYLTVIDPTVPNGQQTIPKLAGETIAFFDEGTMKIYAATVTDGPLTQDYLEKTPGWVRVQGKLVESTIDTETKDAWTKAHDVADEKITVEAQTPPELKARQADWTVSDIAANKNTGVV